ncbi:unnamed protein product [Effrenium voratum]|nr:unnamed protein product [Effrenium voratum]
MGVEATCFLTLLAQIAVISLCSSAEPLKLMSVKVSPQIQVACASWCLVGIPVTISAGVGVLYHIDHMLRTFFWYLTFSFFIVMAVPAWLLTSGKVCESAVEDELQRLGPAFVCGFTETFVFMWTMVAGLLHAYLVYVVWSAAEEISEIPYNSVALTAYASKMQFMAGLAPPPAQPAPVPVMTSGNNPFASLAPSEAHSYGAPEEGPLTARSASARSGRSAPSMRSMGAGGNPQSFFPAPTSGADFQSEIQATPPEAEAPQELPQVPTSQTGDGTPQSFFPVPQSDVDFRSSI